MPRAKATAPHGKNPATGLKEFPQVAALCWRHGKKGREVLLITTRRSGRWIIPKGWPMPRLSNAQAAAVEAWEEAGVRVEKLKDKSIGDFGYVKLQSNGKFANFRAEVFKLKVKKLSDRYPEKGQRKRMWICPKKAAKLVREPELKALLRDFSRPSS